MTYGPTQLALSLSEEELAVLHEVATAMRMTADEFLVSELPLTTANEARGYMKAFAAHATDPQIRTMYYLTRALTEKGKGELLR